MLQVKWYKQGWLIRREIKNPRQVLLFIHKCISERTKLSHTNYIYSVLLLFSCLFFISKSVLLASWFYAWDLWIFENEEGLCLEFGATFQNKKHKQLSDAVFSHTLSQFQNHNAGAADICEPTGGCLDPWKPLTRRKLILIPHLIFISTLPLLLSWCCLYEASVIKSRCCICLHLHCLDIFVLFSLTQLAVEIRWTLGQIPFMFITDWLLREFWFQVKNICHVYYFLKTSMFWFYVK